MKLTGLNSFSGVTVWAYTLFQMISAEAPVLFAKAAQIFITELTLRAWIHTEDNKRRTLQVMQTPLGRRGQTLPLPALSSRALDQWPLPSLYVIVIFLF